MTTIVQILTQIFLRVVKLILCFAFAPIPIALAADDEGRGRCNPVYLKSTLFPYEENIRSADIDKTLSEISSNMSVIFYSHNEKVYSIGLAGLSSTVGSTNAISTIVAMLFLNGMYLAVIQYASQFAEKLTGGH